MNAKARAHYDTGIPFLVTMTLAIPILFTLGVWWAAIMDVSLSPTTWYVARGSGLGLYLICWYLLASGLGGTTKFMAPGAKKTTWLSLHRYSFYLFYGALLIHVLSLIVDPRERWTVADVALPFHARSGDLWIALGIIGAYLMLIVGMSEHMRKRHGRGRLEGGALALPAGLHRRSRPWHSHRDRQPVAASDDPLSGHRCLGADADDLPGNPLRRKPTPRSLTRRASQGADERHRRS